MQSIMMATDGSEQAGEALDFAIELARETGANIEIVVVHPPRMAGRGGAMPILEIEQPGGAGRIAARAAKTVEQAGLPTAPHVLNGDPAQRDLRARGGHVSGHRRARLPRAGSHRQRADGSVSRAVVKKCTRPVTVVKASSAAREPASA